MNNWGDMNFWTVTEWTLVLNDIETIQKSDEDYLFPLIDIDDVDPVHTGLKKVDDETDNEGKDGKERYINPDHALFKL